MAGIIFDNISRGRRKHIWVSTSPDLKLEAEADFKDIGAAGVAVSRAPRMCDESRES